MRFAWNHIQRLVQPQHLCSPAATAQVLGACRGVAASPASPVAGKGLANKHGVKQAHADLLVQDRSKKPPKIPETQKATAESKTNCVQEETLLCGTCN